MKLRWGILGLGSIANKFATDLALLADHQLVGCASRSSDKANTFAQTHQVSRAYGDYQAIIHDPNIDVIYIATPHNSHLEYSLACMEAGKHVLCEKPIAVNQIQVKLLVEASQSNNVFLMEALWSRFNPSIQKALAFIESGIIGKITSIEADFNFKANASDDSRLFSPQLAGGALLDIGIYPLFLSYLVLGLPYEIECSAQFHPITHVDVQTSALLTYDKAIARLNFGLLSDSETIAKIDGTEGSITIPRRWHEAQGLILTVCKEVEHIELPTLGNGFTYEIEEVAKCIKQQQITSNLWSHQDSLNLMSMMDVIREQIGLKYPFE